MTTKFNIAIQSNINSIEKAYSQGMLPQRNQKSLFYLDSSCRSQLKKAILSSENKRIIRKTSSFGYVLTSTKDFDFNHQIQNNCHIWAKDLSWQFPTKSIKTIFTDHIFNYIYTWSHQNQTIAYAICLFTKHISHIAYIFYQPQYQKSNLVNTMVLRTIIDSQTKQLNYCYLGRFNPAQNIGYYKRNMPNFQIFDRSKQIWQNYQHFKQI